MNGRSVAVVMSSAYCDAGLADVFGLIPPSFLPAANDPLYIHQFTRLRTSHNELFLTIPADFQLTIHHQSWLEKENIRILRVPSTLSLLQAFYFVLEVIKYADSVSVMLGDTIVSETNKAPKDSISVKVTQNYYEWSEIKSHENGVVSLERGVGDGKTPRLILSGFYRFSDVDLIRNLAASSEDFDEMIQFYSQQQPLTQIELPWFDFGKPALFFQSRRDFLATRFFNSLEVQGNILHKRGNDTAKLKKEAKWFSNLPIKLRLSCPTYLGESDPDDERYEYRLEYLYLPTVAELAVFGDLPVFRWQIIAQRCFEFLETCRTVDIDIDTVEQIGLSEALFRETISEKTWQRLESFSSLSEFDLEAPFHLNGKQYPSVKKMYEILMDVLPPTRQHHLSFFHGDFFFGNMLYDTRSDNLKVIDPRGATVLSHPLSVGDHRYDLAKLCHSVVGLYDMILAKMMNLKVNNIHNCDFSITEDNVNTKIRGAFAQFKTGGLTIQSDEILALTILLFLSMLPLHQESSMRQMAFIANAYRLASSELKII